MHARPGKQLVRVWPRVLIPAQGVGSDRTKHHLAQFVASVKNTTLLEDAAGGGGWEGGGVHSQTMWYEDRAGRVETPPMPDFNAVRHEL